ncbi:ATP-grasp domain-containing protein [Aeromonas hydrophila]|uniref:ATP-grasp domain-containing protein n=1 Tax=Aeromonas hydrophila TaxID=644 RepID=UPI00280CBF7A|nr:ATP-grasp domain-containing protein [Aeromonas hydrophila]HDU8490703.1 ATP-grasp domain-containing protein [Aeromonas hydrophila]
MLKSIWFMEGLSSQRDIVLAVTDMRKQFGHAFKVIASHRGNRPEITSVADVSLTEPKLDSERFEFIKNVVAEFNVAAIHTGRNCHWFEERRQGIESLGVSLTTGSIDLDMISLADDKVRYAHFMEQYKLPVVPSLQINDVSDLERQISSKLFEGELSCIKPVVGIYGIGFWILDPAVSSMAAFNNPDNRRVHPHTYVAAMRSETSKKLPEPMVMMPYLVGPERSVDMLVEQGKVIAAVSRRKEGPLQYIEQSGEAFELAKACAELMRADGLVNVQTRNNSEGKPLLLEINMRPSGGICYSRSCGINLPGIFALRKLGLIDQEIAITMGKDGFNPTVVRSVSSVIALPEPQGSEIQKIKDTEA